MKEALKKPRTEDKRFCTKCGKTGWHIRRDESLPWICSICGTQDAMKRIEVNHGPS
jgi:ribosomal protein L37AE/L43A